MNRTAQAVMLTAIGALVLRVGWTDEHLRYVNAAMKWPLVISGVLLVALAFTVVLQPRPDDEHPVSRATWALLLPIVIGFVVQPPALGGYVADRQSNKLPQSAYDEAAVAPLDKDQVSDLEVFNFVTLAAAHGDVLADSPVRLTGFVTSDGEDWYVTRVSIRCCAADATAFKVRVDGNDPPKDGAWVQVTGTWEEGTGDADGSTPPTIAAAEVATVDEPKYPYE